jgi:hypothetical protein
MLKSYREGTYQSRCGCKRRSWHKGRLAVGTESQLIVGMQVGRGPGSDAPWSAPLRGKAHRYVVRKGRSARFWLLADAGFDGRDVAWTDGVPPVRRGGRLRALFFCCCGCLVCVVGFEGRASVVGLGINATEQFNAVESRFNDDGQESAVGRRTTERRCEDVIQTPQKWGRIGVALRRVELCRTQTTPSVDAASS